MSQDMPKDWKMIPIIHPGDPPIKPPVESQEPPVTMSNYLPELDAQQRAEEGPRGIEPKMQRVERRC